MTVEDLAAAAQRQNEEAAGAGHCTRYVEDIDVLLQVARMMAECQAGKGSGGHAESA